MLKYREDLLRTSELKERYARGFEDLISERQKISEQKRKEYFKNIMFDQEKYRKDFKKMLGWPLVDFCSEGLPRVKSTKLSKEENYTVYRMQFEIFDGLEMCGLYFEMDSKEKKPLVLVQHGGQGTPEHISGFYDSTTNYNKMLERVISYGVHAFAPQLLLWDKEKYGVKYDRQSIDARLKRVGGSITSVELYGLTRILDYFETRSNISNFGMVGLSYGGFYTLCLCAIDARIKSAVSCAFFNSRDSYPWSDWTWFRAAEMFDDAEIAAMVYPRKLCIEVATNDNVFDVRYADVSYERLLELCKDVGTAWMSFIKFDGTHEFCKDDKPIEDLVNYLSNLK